MRPVHRMHFCILGESILSHQGEIGSIPVKELKGKCTLQAANCQTKIITCQYMQTLTVA
jgi:hypothetical protein